VTGYAGTISLSSNAALNQPIGPWITISHNPAYLCTRQNFNSNTRFLYMYAVAPPGTSQAGTVNVDWQNFRIFIPPGYPNIG